jgi:GABA permease
MRRVLIVANRTLGGKHLHREVLEYMAQGPCRFYVLVPATPKTTHHRLVWTEGESRMLAAGRLREALLHLHEIGADAAGQVGDQRPLTAIADLLRVQEFDEIILSTLAPGLSRWLSHDLPSRVRRAFGLPVTHVVAPRPAALDRGAHTAPIVPLPVAPAAVVEDDQGCEQLSA